VLLAVLVVVGKFQVLTSLPANAIVLASVSGVIGLGIGDTLYMVSLKLVGVGRAVPITCTYPLFSLVLAIFVQGETVTIQVVLAAVVIVLGIWLLTREEHKSKDQFQKGIMTKGVIAAVATAIVWSVSIAMIDIAVTLPETGTLDGALAINTLRVSSVAAFLLVSASVADRKRGLLNMQRKTVAILMVAGIVALALGWFFLAYSFLHIPEAQAVPISSTSPLFATFSSIVFLNERLTVKNIGGSLLIVVGVFLLFIV